MAMSTGLPHVRGGVSEKKPGYDGRRRSSPRAWGCFPSRVLRRKIIIVFPTCVGVFLTAPLLGGELHGLPHVRLPHVRGGVSPSAESSAGERRSSPRAWGCFFSPLSLWGGVGVFPTCVGVFPLSLAQIPSHTRLPHVRGGVSPVVPERKQSAVGLPHVRGGVSKAGPLQGRCLWSSPRAWGCFQ